MHSGARPQRGRNLVFAFSFNAVGVPLATTGLVHPVWAMIAMAASVTAVLLNSFGGRLLPKREAPQKVAEATARQKQVTPAEANTDVEAMERVRAQVTLEVPEMHCAGCEQNIEMLLSGREGTHRVEADARTRRVRVTYCPEPVGLHQIEEAVASLGFRIQRAHALGDEDGGRSA